MGANDTLELGRSAVTTGLLLCAPMLMAGLLIGVIVSVILAATQIQEFTLTFIPKILVMAGAFFLCGPWMLRVITTFTLNIFAKMGNSGP
jgi:flagellar biosynthesis protein FliQ